MQFVSVKGTGNPNEENGDYQKALQILYGISYTIKMSKKTDDPIDGYFEYVVPPLEGMWWMKGCKEPDFKHKENFTWISMIRLPEFVTREVFDLACSLFLKKHPECTLCDTEFLTLEEGLCGQIMHKGSYDDEPTTLEKLHCYLSEHGYETDFEGTYASGQQRRHHEIYLSDPRKTAPEKLKTIIRIPIRKK